MSGGGKQPSAPSSSPAVAAVPPAYLANTAPATMPAFMPGQRADLAAQLAAAFGQTPAAWGKSLDQTHQPVRTLNFNVPPPVAKKPATTTTKPATKPATTSPLNMGGRTVTTSDGKQVVMFGGGSMGRNSR